MFGDDLMTTFNAIDFFKDRFHEPYDVYTNKEGGVTLNICHHVAVALQKPWIGMDIKSIRVPASDRSHCRYFGMVSDEMAKMMARLLRKSASEIDDFNKDI